MASVGVLWLLARLTTPAQYVSVGRTVMVVNAALGIAGTVIAAAMTLGTLGPRILATIFWSFVAVAVSGHTVFATVGTIGQAIGVTLPL